MLTRRALFKVVGVFGFGTLLPSKIFGEMLALARISPGGDTQGSSAACQPFSQHRPGEATSPHEIEAGKDLLDSVDCMELAEQYGSFEKIGGYLGGFLAGTCLFCRTGDCCVHPNEFRCDECEISGTTLDFFAKLEGITDEEAMCRLAVLVKSGTLQRRRNEQKVLWNIMSEASWYYHHLLCDTAEGKPGREWLQEQGVTATTRRRPECIRMYQIASSTCGAKVLPDVSAEVRKGSCTQTIGRSFTAAAGCSPAATSMTCVPCARRCAVTLRPGAAKSMTPVRR